MTQTSDASAREAPPVEMVNLVIDDVEVSVPKGTLVIRAAELLGVQIPRFCDHPLLDPVGACRQCLVEVELLPCRGGGQPFRLLAGAFLPENRLAEDSHENIIRQQEPVSHQQENHAEDRHIDQRHKTLSDPADHEHIDRRAEEHGDPHRQHHADKVVGHADHIDDELDHDQHCGEDQHGQKDHHKNRSPVGFHDAASLSNQDVKFF